MSILNEMKCVITSDSSTTVTNNTSILLEALVEMPHEDSDQTASNFTDYTWVHDYWIPPIGVPTYLPTQMLSYFSKRNVLFMGDSTTRRSYATLYDLMNSTHSKMISGEDHHDIKRVEVDSQTSINFGKPKDPKRPDDYICRLKGRNINGAAVQVACRDVPGSLLAESRMMDQDLVGKGKFDYIRANCYSNFVGKFGASNASDLAEHIKNDYDTIIIGTGIWEVTPVNKKQCKKAWMTTNSTELERLNATLHLLKDYSIGGPRIAFRTLGFDEKRIPEAGEPSWDLNDQTRHFFYEQIFSKTDSDDSNMILVDWGQSISKRSYSDSRIAGDNPVHYGLNARLLFIQQLMVELLKAD